MDEKHTADGRNWITDDALCIGDYGGAGSVGAANIKSLMETHSATFEQWSMSTWDRGDTLQYNRETGHSEWTPVSPAADTTLIITRGSYSSEQAWLLDTPDARETIDALADYPCIDDEAVSEIETEWETEAWASWLKSDLLRAIGRIDTDLRDLVDDFDDTDLWTAYRAAMDDTNTYPEAEYSGVHVDVDRIADAFAQHVIDAIGA